MGHNENVNKSITEVPEERRNRIGEKQCINQ